MELFYEELGRVLKEVKSNEVLMIMGDMNADPIDGDSYPGAINQLLDHPSVNIEKTEELIINFSFF